MSHSDASPVDFCRTTEETITSMQVRAASQRLGSISIDPNLAARSWIYVSPIEPQTPHDASIAAPEIDSAIQRLSRKPFKGIAFKLPNEKLLEIARIACNVRRDYNVIHTP